MQKKVIALAVAALASSAAFAQTNVTIYGVMDVGQAFVKSSGAADGGANQSTVGRLDSNSSHIGFKGVEDLGNGLKAIFQYESGIAADSAGAMAGGRDTFVGLTGGFGTVVAGTLTHPLRAMGAKVELMPGASGVGTTMSVTGRINGANTGADDRAANAIAYVSPSFGGFSGTVAYVNGETQPNTSAGTPATPVVLGSLNACGTTLTTATTCGAVANAAEARSYQIAGQYDNGPLFVGAGYHRADNIGGAGDVDARIYRVAAVYSLPTNTKLTALFDNTKVEGANGAYDKRNAWSIGAAQSFGKNTVGLEYGRSGKIKTQDGTEADTKSSIWSALYTYTLSKRTSVHARYSKLTNQDGINNNFYINPVSNGVTTGAGSDYTGYMVGLRHAF